MVRGFLAVVTIAALLVLASFATADDHGFLSALFGGHSVHGSGVMKSDERDLGPFDKIDLEGGFDLKITIGQPQKVVLTIDDNLIDYIKTRVHGKTLQIFSDHSYSSDHGGKIAITVPSLEAVSSAGSGTVTISGLSGEKFEYSLAGSGDLIADGKVVNLDISVDGSGNVDTRELDADRVEVVINGSGDVKVKALKQLNGTVNGSGDIEYSGDPEDVTHHVSGSGTITQSRGHI
ncbi:MAG TPA: head GIN domain-containing protein [Candidatus Acidoferrum sp.]|nr:head GIN domain-containing protein [Candidatus Acidoferrum sp.]